MASEDHDGGGDDAASAPKRKLDPQLLLVLGNTLLVLGALGTFIYTKILYEKPPIVEETEIQKKEDELKVPAPSAEKVIVPFDQMILNIAMDGAKAHYATVAFAVECRDADVADIVRYKKALFTDKLIAIFGKRQLSELNTIQGKLLLKNELLGAFNQIVPQGAITDFYFSTFMLQ
jgi:flagellar FliL protein